MEQNQEQEELIQSIQRERDNLQQEVGRWGMMDGDGAGQMGWWVGEWMNEWLNG